MHIPRFIVLMTKHEVQISGQKTPVSDCHGVYLPVPIGCWDFML
jgi:hypothetical protein